MNVLANISYEIIKTVAILSEGSNGWRKELNLISWNGRAPKYDIRDWSSNRDKMGKGVTLTEEELQALVSALSSSPKQDWVKKYPLFVSELRKLLVFAKENHLDFSVILPFFTEQYEQPPTTLRGTVYEPFFGEVLTLKEIYQEGMSEFLSQVRKSSFTDSLDKWIELLNV